MSWIAAYNTNGFAYHRLPEALDLLGELGYGGVALTLDNAHLDPYGPDLREQVARTAAKLAQHRLACVIESGARFNLDPRIKHYPSLMTRRHRGRRIAFLERCLEIAAELGASAVSLWSGHDFDELGDEAAFELLADGISRLLVRAEELGVDLAFEPEPGMFSETLDDYARLKKLFPSPRFGLALDLGHLLVTGECDPPEALRRYRGELITVSIEDMRRGVHDHLPFGEGDVDFPPIFTALEEIGYRGLVAVEVSRASSNAAVFAADAMRFLEGFRPV
ncbi:MAG: sugar phosphate isomerase/epimerase family protein [Planctomycetota bacterium]